MEPLDQLHRFDAEMVVQALRDIGAVSVPMIPIASRERFWKEAWRRRYELAKPHTGYEGRVEQNLSTATVPPVSVLSAYILHLERHLTEAFDTLAYEVFATPLVFNEHFLQKYVPISPQEPLAVGLSPHRDFSRNRNLVAVSILGGNGTFTVLDNRAGENPRPLDSTPGNVILIRAEGFNGPNERPWHAVYNVTTPRIILSMRQRVE